MPAVQRVSMITAAALCVAVSAVHVGDQGGFTAFADPDWPPTLPTSRPDSTVSLCSTRCRHFPPSTGK